LRACGDASIQIFMTRIFNIRFLWLLLVFFIVLPTAQAAVDEELGALLKSYDSVLGQQEKALAGRNRPSLEDLKDFQLVTAEIKAVANDCIVSNQESIDNIIRDIGLIGAEGNHEDQVVVAKRKSLDRIKAQHENQLATCRVLLLRTTQIGETALLQQQEIVASQLLTRNESLLEHLQDNIMNPRKGLKALLVFVVDSSGIDLIHENWHRLTLLIAVSMVVALILRGIFSIFISRFESRAQSSFARRFTIALLTCSRHYLLMLFLTGSIAGYFLYLGLANEHFPFISLLSIGLFLYVLLTWGLRIILGPNKPATLLIDLQKDVAEKLMRRLRLLAKLLFVGFLIFSATRLHDFPDFVTGLLRNIYLTLLVLNLCWAFWLLSNIRGLANKHLLRTIIILVLVISLVADWSGYNNLASFILIGIAGSISLWLLTHLILKLWTDFFDSLDDGEFAWQQFIRRKIGVQNGEYIPGSFWFRFTFNLVVWVLFAIAILKIWGLSDARLLAIQSLITDGFDIGPVHVVPSKLIIALLLFALLLSLIGWIKRRLHRSWLNRSRMDRGSKESMVTLTGYVGIIAAFLIALTIAGVELANLALIAGALSVGIGFGLQNVVNNFVSGIVLLFERPIKTGDWIIVGGTQGYVRKIQLRSTLIETFDRADVIVPNAEIIASQVTNWMLNDSVGRVKVPIRAAYGSDPRQVEQILLDIANEHPRVVTNSQRIDKPWVVFKEFGDSALLFELRFFITDIDYYMGVLSDINYAVVEAFNKAGIEIPFPQTDIHLRSNQSISFDPAR